MMSERAVYVVNIDGRQERRPAENPYMLMHKIKKEIKTYYKLDYEFDLFYKGSKVLETSSLNENCFDDSTPLVVVKRDVKLIRQVQQTPRMTSTCKLLPRDKVFEIEIVDLTEINCESLVASNDGCRFKFPIIFVPTPRPVDEEEMDPTIQISTRTNLPPIEIPTDETINVPVVNIPTPPFSSEVQPKYYPTGFVMAAMHQPKSRYRSCSPARNSKTLTLPVSSYSPAVERNISSATRTDVKEKLNSNPLPTDSSNATSGYNSSSSSRCSSAEISNVHLILPIANRDVPTRDKSSQKMSIRIQTLNDVYPLELSGETTFKQFQHLIKQQLQLEKHSNRTHELLFFNFRMHIFKNMDIDNERIDTFLKLKRNHHNNAYDENVSDFFIYALPKKLYENMYIYEKDPTRFFDNSSWWQSHSQVEQISLAQSTLLSTLYVLYQYFRRPPLNEKASRRALEIQFLLYLRKYLFPPAFQALKHMLVRQMFAFEKVILIDGLLTLLAQFCPSSIDRNLLGIYAPHLFCWFFELSCKEMETQDGFLKFDLIRYGSSTSQHYINDPVSIDDLDHDRNVLYEYHEAERYKNVTRNVDLFSLIKYLQNAESNQHYDIDKYTIDMWGCHHLETINRLTETQISELERTMSRVYRSFTLLIRNALENSDVRDQLILVNDKQVGICFKRRQHIKSNGKLDQDLQCFMPADPSHPGIITLNTSDVFEVEEGRPDPRIPSPLRSNLPMKSKIKESVVSAEQITVILLDISDSMFMRRSDKNKKCKRFIDISINMLTLISKNLHRQTRSHAIGIILFGQDVITHCPITTDADEFDKAVYRIPTYGQPWTSMHNAIDTGLNSIHHYESKHSVTSNCEKLIICITDGINNRGALTLDNLKQKIRRIPVVIDLIFFSSQTIASYTPQQRQSIVNFRRFCNQTGGIIYRNSSGDPLDLAAVFEQEAVLWLKARGQQERVFGGDIGASVSHPSVKYPDKLKQTAVRVCVPQRLANESHLRSDFYKRLHDEVNDVVRKPLENMQFYICRKEDGQLDYTFWKVLLQGPTSSLYAKSRWLLYIQFSDDYPVIPPTIRFLTPIFHLNVFADGHISHDLFDISWSTAITMVEIFCMLNEFLIKPGIRNAVSDEYVQLYNENYADYKSRVSKYCKDYASKSIERLKHEYRLEDA